MPSYRYTLPVADALEREAVIGALWRAGALGLWEREHELIAWFQHRVTDVPDGGRWEVEPERDWLEEWKSGLGPVHVGALTVAPSWRVPAPWAGEPDPIVVDPGMAFGTGHHPTTRLCLAALQRLTLDGAAVLDVGTGSGVLAIAAARLGARRIVAVDDDEGAVLAARDNTRRNHVTVDVRLGSIADAGDAAPFDVVVANLVTDTVVRLVPDLLGVARWGGRLIVSGIAQPRIASVVEAITDADARVSEVDEEEGWIAITATREAPGQRHARRLS